MDEKALTQQAADDSDPVKGLQAIATLRQLTERLELHQVEAALRAGLGWTDIAEHLGVTRQAVHKKYAKRVEPGLAPTRRRRQP